MAKINWNLDLEYYGTDPVDDLLPIIERCENQGFKYIPYNFLFNRSARVKTPSGMTLTSSDIEDILEELEFGNRIQIEALEAAEYFKLAEAYY